MKTLEKGLLKLNGGEMLYFTINHNDKMAGMTSLSTSPLDNPLCLKRSKVENLVCSKCFSIRMQKRFSDLEKLLSKNADILTTRLLSGDELPILNCLYFRFEAFGDLINETQFMNYYNIAKANKRTRFALWTKNPFIIANAFKKMGVNRQNRIKNLNIVLSSPKLNEELGNSPFWFVDKVFTVYDRKTIKEKHVKINCGARSCLACHKCYDRAGAKTINEKLK